MSDASALLAAADREARHLLGEIDGAHAVWIISADGNMVAHAGRSDPMAPDNIPICASMTSLGNTLAARSGTGTPRSLVLDTTTCRWVMQTLTVPSRRWFVIVLIDRTSLLAWVLSRISLANQRLSGV